MNLWDELRQRKVVRVAAIYAAVAWGLTEVLGFLVDSFPFVPEWTNTVVALVFVLGFPVSIFLAWMFDVGPGGRIRSTPGSVHGTFTIIAATVVLIAGTAGLFFVIYPGGPPASTPAEPIATTPQANAIAVIPFTNAGADAEDEYFADGLTDELITLLTQIESLRVAARSSAFQFKGRNGAIRDIRDDLGVGTVLDGTVRVSDSGIRIAAQLIDTGSGFQLWAENFDRTEENVFGVPAEIARAVVATLDPQNTELLRGLGGNPEAHKLYLQGKHIADNRRDEAGLREAMQILEAAVSIDTAFWPPHLGIAEVWIMLADNGYVSAEIGYAQAREIAEQVVRRDENVAEAHGLLG